MKLLKTLAVTATFAASMLLSATTQAVPYPGFPYSVEQCDDLSRRIDLAYTRYLNSVAAGSATGATLNYEHYQRLNREYDSHCAGVPHTY